MLASLPQNLHSLKYNFMNISLLNVLCVGMESVPRVISLSSKNTLLFTPAEVRMAIKSVSLRVCVHVQ